MSTLTKETASQFAGRKAYKYDHRFNLGDTCWLTGFQIANGGRGQRVNLNCPPTHIAITGFNVVYGSTTPGTSGPRGHIKSYDVILGKAQKLTGFYQIEAFATEEDAIEYYNLLVEQGIAYKMNCIDSLQANITSFKKHLYIDGKPQVEEKKSRKGNITI